MTYDENEKQNFIRVVVCRPGERAEATWIGYYEEVRSEYYKLCEYVNFHHNELFYLDFGDGNEEIGFGVCDTKSTIDDEGHVNYTGVYFKEIRENGRIVRFLEDQLPNKITLGKFVFSQSEMIDVKQVKVKTVFENGIFVGPSIAAEEKLDY